MTQLILDMDGVGIALPESQKGGYTAYEDDLSVEVEMISGRLVKELRGIIWRVSYQYGYFNETDKNRVIAACRKGRRTPILCSFLPPEGGDMVSGRFWVTNFNSPKFMWSSTDENGVSVPLWGDFSVELREVKPHAANK